MKSKRSRRYWITLALMTTFCFLGLLIRNRVTGSNPADVNLNFMLWNLFLAFVPLPLAWLGYVLVGRVSNVVVVVLTVTWLLFYPNAPYMISDVIHVNKDGGQVLLYDGLLIFSFAVLALFYGFFSLKLIHQVYRKLATNNIAHLVVITSVLLSSGGIYLGRILRLNSWDLFTRPLQVIESIVNHLFPPAANPSTYAIIFFFSAIQFLLLQLMQNLEEQEDSPQAGPVSKGRIQIVKNVAPASTDSKKNRISDNEAW